MRQRPRAHQRVAGAHHGEVVLTLLAPVADRGEQLRVEAPQPRQPRGVEPVGLALAAGDQRDLARVGDDHLMAEVRHDAAQPRRAWPCLEHDPRRGEVLQCAAERRHRGADAPLAYHLPAGAEGVDVRVTIAHVEADGDGGPILALNAPRRCDILLHGRSPTSSRLFRAAIWPTEARVQGASIPLEEEAGPHAISNLESLDLSNNRLTGIPAWLGDFTNLEWLSLGGNELTGPIPAWLGDLSNLELLSLWGNELTGRIPAELGDLSNLESLYLWGNELTGRIPARAGRPLQPGIAVPLEQPVDGRDSA